MSADHHPDHEHGGPGYASPQVARQQPPEQFVYVAALYEGTGIDRPDFIAVVDVDPSSPSYGQIVHRTEMPNVGDEAPRIKSVIEGEEVREKLGLSAPHTVHCMPGDIVTISMLGDADGNTPGGFAVLDARTSRSPSVGNARQMASSSPTTSGTSRARTP
jgi:methanethiol oxidase